MSTSNSRLSNLGFGAALVVIAGMSGVSYLSVTGFAKRAARVEHTQDVLRETEAVLSELKDVETAGSGYLIAGEESFLDPYVDALDSIPLRLRRLKAMTADNADQQENVAELEKLVSQHLRQAGMVLETAGGGQPAPEAARKYVARSKLTMDQVRDVAGKMRMREEALLVQRTERSRRSADMATAVIVAGTLAGIAMLLVAFIYLRREIAQRASAQRAAQASAAETESLYNEAPCGYHSVDRNGTFVRINDTELDWLGYRREEVVGKLKFVDIVAPEFVRIVMENFPKLLQGHHAVDLEYTLVRKDGSTFPVSVNAVPVLDARGNYVMSRTTMFDITAMKKVESQYRQANDFLDAVVENIPSMIFVKEADTLRFVRINRAEEELLGMPRTALIGRSDHELFPKEQADHFTAKDREVLATPGVVEIPEEELTTPNGVLILRTRKIGLRDAAGRPKYLLGISDDISEVKRAEEAIKALNAGLQVRANQLEAANKELESFTYSVSHDLRAPLRAIDGFTKIFEEDYGGKLEDEGRRILKVIRDNSRRMGLLIDDLLAFSRLGRQPLSTEQIAMKPLVLEAVDQIQSGGLGKNACVAVQDLPAANVDRSLFNQVWVNLLSNALKYSSTRESPQIEVGFLPPRDGGDHPTYFVRDNGVGFDMRYCDKLFGVFQRLHRADEFPGTGVGLAIVHRLITRHGGRVWAESEPGKGATFFFTLPGGRHDDWV